MKKGDRIFHRTYGSGIITRIFAEEQSAKYEITFDRSGVQTLKKTYAWDVLDKESGPVIAEPKQEEPMPKQEQPTQAEGYSTCSICHIRETEDSMDSWCEPCMMSIGAVGAAVLTVKNSNQLPRILSTAKRILRMPYNDWTPELTNCDVCNTLIVVSQADLREQTAYGRFCSAECQRKAGGQA